VSGAANTDDISIQDNTLVISSGVGGHVGFIELSAALCAGTQSVAVGPNRVSMSGPGNNEEVIFDGTVSSRAIEHPQRDLTFALAYSASVTTNLDSGKRALLTVTNGTAFTIHTPTSRAPGRMVVYDILNTSGGAMGAVTFDAAFKLAGAFVGPATGKRRLYQFYDDGTNLVEVSRSPADI
jgi:hypothetical protein